MRMRADLYMRDGLGAYSDCEPAGTTFGDFLSNDLVLVWRAYDAAKERCVSERRR